MCSSSYRLARGISTGSISTGRGSGTSTSTSSPARTTRERRAGDPESRTAPSSISFWIRERERSEQADARKRSRRVPWDGRPTRKRRINSRGGAGPPPGKIDQHSNGRGDREQTEELRRQENARNQEPADRIAAERLENSAGDRVQQDVQPEDFAVERPPPIGPLQDQEDHERVQRKVNLRRVERDVQRSSDRLVRERIRERHPERAFGRLSIAAAGGEASPASDRLAERDRRRSHVGDLPGRQTVLSHVPDPDGGRCDQASVEYAAGPKHLDEVAGTLHVVAPLDDDEEELRPQDRGREDVEGEVEDLLFRQAFGPRLAA